MSEAEIYARMYVSHKSLGHNIMAQEILMKAMIAYAEDYNNRTDGNLEKEAKELIKNDLIEW